MQDYGTERKVGRHNVVKRDGRVRDLGGNSKGKCYIY